MRAITRPTIVVPAPRQHQIPHAHSPPDSRRNRAPPPDIREASRYQTKPTMSSTPRGTGARNRCRSCRDNDLHRIATPSSGDPATPSNAMPVCRNRWLRRAMANTTQANPRGRPTLQKHASNDDSGSPAALGAADDLENSWRATRHQPQQKGDAGNWPAIVATRDIPECFSKSQHRSFSHNRI